jgi:ribosomal protein S18 acetylase RimI-like enzyme
MQLRDYSEADEESWLRCRVLAFLHTDYYDDVLPARPSLPEPSVQLVAVEEQEVLGLIDVTVNSALATIDSIAVHPDHARRRIGTALLTEVVSRLRPLKAQTLDAWTRENRQANAWYQANQFTERTRYVHVYTRGATETAQAVITRDSNVPVAAHLHADIAHEAALRARYQRIYTCRRYVRPL